MYDTTRLLHHVLGQNVPLDDGPDDSNNNQREGANNLYPPVSAGLSPATGQLAQMLSGPGGAGAQVPGGRGAAAMTSLGAGMTARDKGFSDTGLIPGATGNNNNNNNNDNDNDNSNSASGPSAHDVVQAVHAQRAFLEQQEAQGTGAGDPTPTQDARG